MQGSIDFTGLLSGDIIGEGGTTVIANPSGSATDTLNKVQIDETIYSVEGGGGTEVIANPTGTPTEDINTIEIDEVIYQIKGEKGDDGADGTDGTSAYASVSKSGNTATITCTDANGTTTAQISDGINGTDGTDGTDGTSAYASVSKSGNTAIITCTDANGTTTAQISDGADGADGQGVPTGGSAGQVLIKDSATDYDTSWTSLDASDIPYDNTTSGMTATDVQDAVSELKSNLTDLKTLESRSYLIGGNYQEDEYTILCVYNEHLKHVQIDAHPRTVSGSWSETVAKGNYVLTRVPFIPRYTIYIPINRTDGANVCAVLKIRKTEYNNQNIGEISVELLDNNTPKGVQLCTHLEYYYDDDSIIPSQS